MIVRHRNKISGLVYLFIFFSLTFKTFKTNAWKTAILQYGIGGTSIRMYKYKYYEKLEWMKMNEYPIKVPLKPREGF